MPKNILIFTGNGKGKSTAAFGMAIRAFGHGHRVCILQFMKADDSTGEVATLRDKLGIDMRQLGLGFVPKKDHPAYAEHKAAAETGFAEAVCEMVEGEADLLILDEICGSIALGLLDETLVIQALNNSRDNLNIVLTGRNASAMLIEQADTVSEMVPHKHALEAGIPARAGVEY
jgi:cob(I)alamin adenosyltransferase